MTLVCASVTSTASAQKAVRLGADAVEWRFDLFDAVPDRFVFDGGAVHIATFRTRATEKLLSAALAAGADFVDVAYDSPLCGTFPPEAVICSYHDFEKTPRADEIVTLFDALAENGVPKAAFMVRSIIDLIEIARAAEVLQKRFSRFILIGMGECGKITRIRAALLGSFVNFCSVDGATAPGQQTMGEAKTDCRYLCGVTGWPLEKTFSPAIHTAAFSAAGMNGAYVRLPCRPEDVGLLPELMRAYQMTGLNVTIPHKQAVIPYLREISPTAKAVGAVNTVTADLKGDNTDVAGIAATFDRISPAGKNVLLLGAGGAARAAAYYFTTAGARLSIMNRTYEKAAGLAKRFGAKAVAFSEDVGGAEIIVNATPASPALNIPQGAVIMDMNYPASAFLAAAKDADATTISGKTMLIYQAAEAFFLWTGVRPDCAAMTAAFEREA